MSRDEIIKELKSDYEIVLRKIGYVFDKENKIVLRNKKYPIIKTYRYKSPVKKNTWVFGFQWYGKNNYMVMVFNYHYTNKGLMIANFTVDSNKDFSTLNDGIVFYSSHFFERYNERGNIGLESTIERAEKWFLDNMVISFSYGNEKEEDSSVCDITGTDSSGGMLLGTSLRDKIIIWNTYISNDMLKGDQVKISKSQKEFLEDKIK